MSPPFGGRWARNPARGTLALTQGGLDNEKARREKPRHVIGFGVMGSVAAVAQSAPKVFVSPNKAQSQEQQSKDTAECQQWANQQAQPAAAQTGHARGTAGGAAAGAAVGAIAGDTGKGAAAGAVVGGVGGRRRSKKGQQAAEAGAQSAFAACMESRGYSVK